jgi:hypothetical protein
VFETAERELGPWTSEAPAVPRQPARANFFAAGWPSSELGVLRARATAVTAADVQRAARRWFTRDRVQIAAYTRADAGGYDLAQFGRVDWFELATSVTK